MGTSQSSSGPGGGVPMVPPWTPPATPAPGAPDGGAPGAGPPADGDGQDAPPPAQAAPAPPPRLAPPGRFQAVRLNLGEYSRTGDGRALRRGLGQYVRNGYGGAATATRRFGGTARTAGALSNALAGLAGGDASAAQAGLDRPLLAGRTADEIMDAVVEAVRPIDGTQDAEAERASIRDAMTDLLTVHPDADLLNLDPAQRALVVERFAASDVFRRFDLDVGKALRDKAPSAAAAMSRLKQVRDYIREAVAAAFRQLRDAGHAVTAGRVSEVVRDALRETFTVFEGYAE